jgi:cyclic pyranopterin phosphate synthase
LIVQVPVFTTAIIAGVQAAKKTSELIPFCHPLALEKCDVEVGVPLALCVCAGILMPTNAISSEALSMQIQVFSEDAAGGATLKIACVTKTTSKTGVEMEALTGASMAALTVFDMCKSASPQIEISGLRVVSKSGGKSDVPSVSTP